MHPPLTGLIAAPHTPFNADGSLNLDRVEDQAAHLLSHGVGGVFVAGTTGECHSLTVEERLALARRWHDSARGSELKVIIQVGHNCQADAMALAAQASLLGVAGVAAFAPCFHKPATVDDLLDFLAPIAAECGEVPFYFYDIPSMTGVRLPTADLLERGRARIPSLRGLKFSNPDLMELQRCLGVGDVDVLFGLDEMLLAALALGCRGAVGATYNFAARIYNQVIEDFTRGQWDDARRAQRRAVELVAVLQRFNFLPASKAAMALVGVNCGPVRTPLRSLNEDEVRALAAALEPLIPLRSHG